jgi:hypothetical protein
LGCLVYVVLFGLLVWVFAVSFALGILSVSYRQLCCIVEEFSVIIFGPCQLGLFEVYGNYFLLERYAFFWSIYLNNIRFP